MGVPRMKLRLAKGDSRKTFMNVTPLSENLNPEAMKCHADKIRKVNQTFEDRGYRVFCKDDPIKHPGLHRLAFYLNRMSVVDTVYFWNNWELDPVCVYAYEIAKFFDVHVEFENPKDESREN